MTTVIKNIINHIGLVLDASGSMQPHAQNLIKAADAQIQHLALRSTELDQETRISVWTFDYWNNIQCVVWDKDVLRLPSIASFYKVNGQTAFIDATLKSLDDLKETPERYGDHSFLVFVLTDGEENNSRKTPVDLANRLNGLPDHWTVAALVPNARAKHEAKRFGFPAGNVEVWDTTSASGIQEVSKVILTATDNFMTARSHGLRSTNKLFSMDSTAVNAATIAQAGLTALPQDQYVLIPVPKVMEIREFTKECGLPYVTGRGYYELSKTEHIQANKNIAIVERATAKVFMGREARQLLGLRDEEVKVKPDQNANYRVFVQSTSVNRKLMPNTSLLYLL